ncbi:lectin CPL-like [Salvia hispanica]|uniref:lectin CPL-like n=1 Tax=Salvia hispanica TaxID=49212 RepID=UPI0020098D7C|nr:lectin CPL-like [Salvia hispanica]
MAKLLQTLISLLSCIALLLDIANTAQSQTTSFSYAFNGEQPTDLLYQGDTHFPSDSTYLRLINIDSWGFPVQQSAGRAVYSKPIQFWEVGAPFQLETTVKFIITPINPFPANGFTFFIQPVGSPIGSPGESFGIFDINGTNPSVFAVEIDLALYYWQGDRHVGIDIGSVDSKNRTDVGTAILGQEVTARINYHQSSQLISVHVTAGSQTFEVSYVYDLTTILPQQVEVGLSAATGPQVAIFDVIAWDYSSTLGQTTSTLVKTSANRELEDAKIRQYV